MRLSECGWGVNLLFTPPAALQKKYRHTHARALFCCTRHRHREGRFAYSKSKPQKCAAWNFTNGFFFTPALKPTAFESKRLHGSGCGPVWTTGASFRRMHKFSRSSSKWSRKKLAAENRGAKSGDERQMMRNGARRPSYFLAHLQMMMLECERERGGERPSRVPFRSNISSECER